MKELAAVAGVCSRLRGVAQSDELWRPQAVCAFKWKPDLVDGVRRATASRLWLRRRASPSELAGAALEGRASSGGGEPPQDGRGPADTGLSMECCEAAAAANAAGAKWLLARTGKSPACVTFLCYIVCIHT